MSQAILRLIYLAVFAHTALLIWATQLTHIPTAEGGLFIVLSACIIVRIYRQWRAA